MIGINNIIAIYVSQHEATNIDISEIKNDENNTGFKPNLSDICPPTNTEIMRNIFVIVTILIFCPT